MNDRMNMQQWGLGMRERLQSDTLENRITDWRSKLQVLQTKAAVDAQFWSGDWRLGIAEERVMLAEKRLVAAEMTISSRLPHSNQAANGALIIKGL